MAKASQRRLKPRSMRRPLLKARMWPVCPLGQHHRALEGEVRVAQQSGGHGGRANQGAGEDDENGQMDHIDAEPGPGAALGEEQASVCGRRLAGLPAVRTEQGRGALAGLATGAARSTVWRQGCRSSSSGAVSSPSRRTVRIARDAFQAAHHQVHGEQGEQGEEPPGVVHVGDIQQLEKPGGLGPVFLDVERRRVVLRDDGADDRGGGEQEQEQQGQLDRGEN